MKNKKPCSDSVDERVRFGWCWCLDGDPEIIYEKRKYVNGMDEPKAVAVVPLPFMSAKMKAKVRAFAKEVVWPK